MTGGGSKIVRILNEQRCSGKMCDLNFKLDNGDHRVWAHFSVIAAQSEFVGNKYLVQSEMQFSIQHPLTIELQHFHCEICLRNVIDFMYSDGDDHEKNVVYPPDNLEHSQHVQQLARLLSIGDLLRDEIEPDVVAKTEGDFERTVVGPVEVVSLQVETNVDDRNKPMKMSMVRPRPKTFQYKIQTKPALSKMHKCLGCAFKCYKPPEMLFHMKNCGSKNTKCNMCDKRFNTMTEFKGHLVRHEHLKPFFCCDCDLRFTTKTSLNLHTPKHSRSTPHPCLECGKRFKWKHGLDNHMIVHSTEKQLLCDECGYSTSHLKTLRAHQLGHTGFSYRCTTTGCNYSSRRKENLKIHIATHRNETPFVCEVCGHRFSQNKNLKRHALLHVAKNLHKCPHCEFTNYRTDKMKEHIVRQHTEKPLQLELAEIVPSALDDGDTSEVLVVGPRKKPPSTNARSARPKKVDPNKGTPPVFILPKGVVSSPVRPMAVTSGREMKTNYIVPDGLVSSSSLVNQAIKVKSSTVSVRKLVRGPHPTDRGFAFILPKEPIDIDTAMIISNEQRTVGIISKHLN